jgi:hypothetical protein
MICGSTASAASGGRRAAARSRSVPFASVARRKPAGRAGGPGGRGGAFGGRANHDSASFRDQVVDEPAHRDVLDAIHEELDDVLPLGRAHEVLAVDLGIRVGLEVVDAERVAQHEEEHLAVELAQLARPPRGRLRIALRSGARGAEPRERLARIERVALPRLEVQERLELLR